MRMLGTLRRSLLTSLVVALLVGTSALARAEEPGTEHQSKRLRLSLLSDVETLAPGASFRVGVRMQMEYGWHAYWKEPGDAGLAPTFRWSLPPGFEVDAASWPLPAWHKSEGIWTIVYEPEVLFVFRVRAPETLPSVSELSVGVDWVVCHDAQGCLPGQAALSLRLPRGAGEAAGPSVDAAAFDQHRANAPRPVPSTWRLSTDRRFLHLAGEGPWTDTRAVFDFFPEDLGTFDRSAEILHARNERGVTLRLPFEQAGAGPPDAFRGVVTIRSGGTTIGYGIGWGPGEAPSPGTTPEAVEKNGEATADLELFASLDQAVGNIAFLPDGQLVFSHHPFFKPDVRVATYDATSGSIRPFPTRAWNTPRSENDWYLDDVLGIRSDARGIVWMLDMGTRNDVTPKLVGWSAKTDELHRIYYIPAPASTRHSQLNDFVVDSKRGVIVIADEGIGRGGDGSKAALVIVDLNSGRTRRVLEGHATTAADTNRPIMIDGSPMSVSKDGKATPIFVGADGITLDAESEWLYYSPLNGSKIYRIRMDALLDQSLPEEQLGARVEAYSSKDNNGGLSIDKAGNLYLTNVESRSIGLVSAGSRKLSVLASDSRMLWPDGVSYCVDGYMYVSAAQVHLGAPFNGGADKTSKPFYIFRFKPAAEGIPGR